MLSLEGAHGDLTNACKYLKGDYIEDGARLFSIVPRGNKHKLKHRRCSPNSREPRQQFPRHCELSPPERYSKAIWTSFWQLDLNLSCLKGGWSLGGSFELHPISNSANTFQAVTINSRNSREMPIRKPGLAPNMSQSQNPKLRTLPLENKMLTEQTKQSVAAGEGSLLSL